MYYLKEDGVLVAVGDQRLLWEFEGRVWYWLSQSYGWDVDGVFLSLRYLPDVPEYLPLENDNASHD